MAKIKFKTGKEQSPRPVKKGSGVFAESTPSDYVPTPKKVKEEKEDYTLLLKSIPFEYMEKFKNIIYTLKIKGDYFSSQQTVGLVALKKFLDEYKDEIIERPEKVKEIERKRSKRKK